MIVARRRKDWRSNEETKMRKFFWKCSYLFAEWRASRAAANAYFFYERNMRKADWWKSIADDCDAKARAD